MLTLAAKYVVMTVCKTVIHISIELFISGRVRIRMARACFRRWICRMACRSWLGRFLCSSDAHTRVARSTSSVLVLAEAFDISP
jgi:hypothetical protein